MNTRNLMFLFCIVLICSVSFAWEWHCWRQDKSRAVQIDYNFSSYYSDSSNGMIVPKTATFTVKGFGNYIYQCENGASGQSNNYIEIYDNLTGEIIRTNGTRGTSGPVAIGSTSMCMKVGSEDACYIEDGVMQPARGTCRRGSLYVGGGVQDSIQIPMTEYKGAQDWTIRLGEISPSASDIVPGDLRITFRELGRVQFFVDSSEPAVLIFPPTPLQKLNSFDSNGVIEKTVRFTILNKSRVPSLINSYDVICPSGVICELDKLNGVNIYQGFIVDPNQAHMIDVTYKLNKANLPTLFSSFLTVRFTPLGFGNCDVNGCTATSSPLKFEAGLIKEQKFQINVSNMTEQKYCVDYEGRLGRTGPEYAPRINLYFGGNMPTSMQTDNLISLNECSPVDFNTGLVNPNWVYCTQNEFLVQLSARLGIYARNMKEIKQAEQVGNFSLAASIRSENSKIKIFDAYLREQDLSIASRNESILKMLDALSSVAFEKTGYAVGEVTNQIKFKNLIDSVLVQKTINGVLVSDTKFSPGLYRITLDLNDTGSQDLGGLFIESSDSVNPNMNVKAYIEKVSDPKLNWVFYYMKDNFDGNIYTPTTQQSFVTNYSERGTIMVFEGKGANVDSNKFYSTYAIPLIVRIVDNGSQSISDSTFTFATEAQNNDEVFSVWSGFASSLSKGCETTSTRAKEGNKALPYRILDNGLGSGLFEITDLNSVKPNSKIYLSTVLYMPLKNIQLTVPFKTFSLSNSVDANASAPEVFRISLNDYENYTIDSLSDVFEGIKNQKVCVYYDNSTSKETWKLFWNQDFILDELKNAKRAEIVADNVTICDTRDKQSS